MVCAALGDASWMSSMRLQYGTTGINPISCLKGDFDDDGSFTLNDAAHVAEVQFNLARFPWHTRRLELSPNTAPQRERVSHTSGARTCMSIMKDAATLQVGVHVSRADTSDKVGGRWKAISMQFAGGKIASIKMHHGSPGQITVQHTGRFFQAAELGGNGLSWPAGLAATVTFEGDTDIAAVQIDYDSMNTYIVQHEDHGCVSSTGTPCRTAAVYFRSDQENSGCHG